MIKLIKEFEDRMLQRLERDFYSQGLTLKEENSNSPSKQFQNENPKKRKLIENNSNKDIPLKKMKSIVFLSSILLSKLIF